jgi:hypothetical protein
VLKEREPEFARRKDAGLQEKLDTVGEKSLREPVEEAEGEVEEEPEAAAETAEEPALVGEGEPPDAAAASAAARREARRKRRRARPHGRAR